MEFTRTQRRKRGMSLVPMINVIFMLVFFFLVGGQLEKVTILPVELPVATSGQKLEEGPIEIVLGKYDEILINDHMVDSKTLATALQPLLQQSANRIITIKVDAFLEANALVRILETIGRAGGKNISLVTQEAKAP